MKTKTQGCCLPEIWGSVSEAEADGADGDKQFIGYGYAGDCHNLCIAYNPDGQKEYPYQEQGKVEKVQLGVFHR
jgi:hypothetical protein